MGMNTLLDILDLLEERLEKKGLIKSAEAWQICKSYYGYSTIIRDFRLIMESMVEQKKAVKIGYGKWKIL